MKEPAGRPVDPTRRRPGRPAPDPLAWHRRQRRVGVALVGLLLVVVGALLRQGVYVCGWFLCLSRRRLPASAEFTQFPLAGPAVAVAGVALCAAALVAHLRERRRRAA